jgi:two-component system, LuxR family, sensor kinase FixL
MAGLVEASDSQGTTPSILHRARAPLITVVLYMASYVILDRISMVQMLPDLGFSIWNPPPASSLALLLTKGFRFAPALLPAAVLADGINGDFPAGFVPSLAMDAVIACGYSLIAAALRPVAGPTTGFQSVRGVVQFLGIVCVGVLAVAWLVGLTLMLMHALPSSRLVMAVRHFWVGDVTGIVGLFPVLMTAHSAWQRWKEIPARTRVADLALFALALAFALWVVFGVAVTREWHFFYLLLLPMIWIGVRHGLPWCSVAILIEQLALITIVVTEDYSLADFTDFQIFSLAIAITGLVIGAVVTERQHTELRLRQQQAELGRMARVTTAGVLGSTIVHEISQPLATVSTYAHVCSLLLRANPGRPEVLIDTLAKLESEVLRAGKIVDRLRDFLSNGETRLTALDVREIAREVAAALADEARSRRVNIAVDAQTAMPIIANRLQMEQVLLNLIRNAIEAAAENRGRERLVRIDLRRFGNKIRIDVEDNGPGVPPDIAERLFEPFATGKPRGMGLGLVLSRQIVRFHGGDLWCDGSASTGARFTIRLPCDGSNTDG